MAEGDLPGLQQQDHAEDRETLGEHDGEEGLGGPGEEGNGCEHRQQ